MSMTQAMQQQALDNVFVDTDYIAWASDSSGTLSAVARTAVTDWTNASAATPSVKENASALTSAVATGPTDVTHWATFSASTGGVQKSTWEPVDNPRSLLTGDTLTVAAGSLRHTLD